MISCIIVDDEQHAIDVLAHFVNQTPLLTLKGTTADPLEALQLINREQVDLIFLDIQMPHISGIDFIKAINGRCKVILTTAYSEFAAEGFDLEVVDYLLKPIPLPRFLKAVQRAAAVLAKTTAPETETDDYIFVKTEAKGKMLKINLADIDYIEGMKNYVAIHTGDTKTLALLNMKDLEDRLQGKHFMRVHRSYIIAIGKITMIEGNKIMLKKGQEILLGDSYRTAFLEAMKGKLMTGGGK
ncbi:LytR/AlgR family response regulator transcription factor [Terrimonas ferruginea]|uniref:LytR/AlgR family response regulator transcription factor n=1 Tax=Terrimonas ferruginea TaxID=249 RepID=UPI0004282974|nr:LytTR family DNA-binding domain-containing protein [Terrimonas ferruginea]